MLNFSINEPVTAVTPNHISIQCPLLPTHQQQLTINNQPLYPQQYQSTMEHNPAKEQPKGPMPPAKTVNLYCKTAKNYLTMAIDWMEACQGQSYKKIYQQLEVLKSYLANIEQKIQQASEKSAENEHQQPQVLNHKIAQIKRRMEESKKQIAEQTGDKIQQYQAQKTEKEKEERVKVHKPKHPVSSFFVFYKEKGQTLAQQNGLSVGSKVAKFVAELWNNMSLEEKEPYQVKARQARDRYQSQMGEFKRKYPVEFAKLKKDKKFAKLKKKEELERQGLEEFNKVLTPKEMSAMRAEESSSDSGVKQQYHSADSSDSSQLLQDNLSNSLDSIAPVQQKGETTTLTKPKYAHKAKPQMQQQTGQNSDMFSMEGIDQAIIDYLNGDKANSPSSSDSYRPGDLQKKAKGQSKKGQTQSNHKTVPDDLVRPKGPTSSFLLYYRAMGKELSQIHNIPQGPKLVKVASEVWNKLGEEEKKPFIEESKISRDEYHKEMNKLRQIYGTEALVRKKGPKAKSQKK